MLIGSTMKLDFSKLPAEFAVAEIMSYITTNLQMKKDQMERVHYRPFTKTVFIDVKDHGIAFRRLAECDPKQAVTFRGKTYKVPITMDDGSIVIKLHDLPKYITNEEIFEVMERYGTVISMGEGRWGNKTALAKLLNGCRYVQLIVNTPIPLHVEIAGEKSYVSFPSRPARRRDRFTAEENHHQPPDAHELLFYRFPGYRNPDDADLVIDTGFLPPSREQPSPLPTTSGLSPRYSAERKSNAPRQQVIKRQAEQPQASGSKQRCSNFQQ